MAKPIGSARLVFRRDLTDTLGIFRFTLEDGTPSFEPGQFLTIGLPIPVENGRILWRAFSIASPPCVRDHLELYVRRPLEPVPGRLTSELWRLPIGGTLLHRGVGGAFTIEHARADGSPETRTLLLAASGTGIAPFIAYALELRERRSPRELVVLHGASHVVELGYDGILRALEDETRGAAPGAFRLRYVPTISRPADPANAAWRGETGRVESLITPREGASSSRLEEIVGPLTPEAFFCHACGYGASVRAIQAALVPKGFRTRRDRRPDGSFDLKIESYG